jgi:hypothetical protein
MEFSIDKFNEVKHNAEDFYNNIGSVHCPYFGEEVYFNTKGFDHLIFKDWNRTRVVNDQFSRLRHLSVAPEIIRQSKTLQGLWKTQKLERIKRKEGWIKVLKLIYYYEFIAVVDSHGSKIRVKIIVKQIDGGEKFFLSIIPFWGTNKNTGERILCNGNPEND